MPTSRHLNSAIPPALGHLRVGSVVRLLLLTGCRPGEIRSLRWCEVKPDRLALTEAKTGPRHVLLSEAARELLNRLAETASGE